MPKDRAQQFADAFGQAVRERRTELGLSQERLGFDSEIDRTYISGIECGHRNPTLRSVWTIASALDTDPAVLVSRAMAIVRGS